MATPEEIEKALVPIPMDHVKKALRVEADDIERIKLRRGVKERSERSTPKPAIGMARVGITRVAALASF